MKSKIVEIFREKLKARRSPFASARKVPLLVRKYGSRAKRPGYDDFRLEKDGLVQSQRKYDVNHKSQWDRENSSNPDLTSSSLRLLNNTTSQYTNHISLSKAFVGDIAQKCIQGFYDARRQVQVKNFESAIDYTWFDRCVDRFISWLFSPRFRSMIGNHLRPTVVFFVCRKGKKAVKEYARLFEDFGCLVEAKTSLRSFVRSVRIESPPIIHYLSAPKACPVTDNGVSVAAFDYEGSCIDADAAKGWCLASYGYLQNWRDDESSLRFFQSFYSLILNGRGVLNAYNELKLGLDMSPRQFTNRTKDFRIIIPQNNKLSQTKGTYDTTGNF